MKTYVKNHQAGFTLIEYIVALVVAAIVASMVYTYFGNALTQSSVPIARLKSASNLRMVMENIVADHNRLNAINMRYKWRSNTAYSIGDVVLPSTGIDNATSTIDNTRGRYYQCITAGTSSGSTIPSWPAVGVATTTLNRTVTDGSTVVWNEQGYVWKTAQAYPTNSIVVPAISNGHYYRGGGTSGATDPKTITGGWPIATGGTVSDGTLTWTEAGTILDSTYITDTLKNYLTTNPARYGTGYTVTETKFIQFNSSTSTEVDAGTNGTSSEKNNLKVTIKNNDSAETLTSIFTIR
jgi:prepilin-type N-terminal cleavage/methylation domain-containing protein